MAAHPGKCYAGPNCVLCQTLRARERGAKTKRTAPQLATRTTKSTSKRSGTARGAASCGSLSDAEYRQLMRQLQRREELTPDDYELLLRLDEAVLRSAGVATIFGLCEPGEPSRPFPTAVATTP